MKVLFLDIDGVVNCQRTTQRHHGLIGIDPYLASLVRCIILAVSELKVVLSSTWRNSPDGLREVENQVAPIFDITPRMKGIRGDEIKTWLDRHPEVQQYAIIDDSTASLREEQIPHLFLTSWEAGITEEIVVRIIDYFRT